MPLGPGGMPSPGLWQLIGEVSAVGLNMISWTGIPQDFHSLVIWYQLRCDVAAQFLSPGWWFNKDTTATNYRQTMQYVSYTAVGSAAGNNNLLGWLSGANSPAGAYGYGEILIQNYANSFAHKQAGVSVWHERNSGADFFYKGHGMLLWQGLAPITQIDLYAPGQLFTAGSVARLMAIR